MAEGAGMVRILLTAPVEVLHQRLSQSCMVLTPAMLTERDRGEIQALVTSGIERVDAAAMDDLPMLKLIVAIAAGAEGVDMLAAQVRGIEVRTGSGANSDDVADLAVGLLISSVRDIVGGDQLVRQGLWRPGRFAPRRSIGSLRVGIVGLGHIGAAVAGRLAICGCELAWTGPRPKPRSAHRYVPQIADLASWSDALILAAPLTPESRSIVDRRILDALGPQGVLVNVSRGGLVDEGALIDALRAGTLGAAALDVFETEPTPADRWRDVPNLIVTPHVGGMTSAAFSALLERAAANIEQFVGSLAP